MLNGWQESLHLRATRALKKISIRHRVIQSEAKDLENTHVHVHEILPPYGRLNDKSFLEGKVEDKILIVEEELPHS